MGIGYDGPEALEWLRSSRNKSALAGNRFGPTSEAIKFVERLYALGARKIVIPRNCILAEPDRIRNDGGPYADTLVVVMPDDRSKRRGLWEVCAEEITAEGFDPDKSAGRPAVFLWWD